MRTVFIFPAGERAETVASLDRPLPQQSDPWTLDRHLYINIDDEQAGHLFSDSDPDDVAALDAAIGHHPTWAVQVDTSGRIDGTAEVRQLVALLLEHGGVATDDFSAHPWTLQEIESGAVIDGLRFFDYRTYHELDHRRRHLGFTHRPGASSESAQRPVITGSGDVMKVTMHFHN
jgi:hypothetical protein